MGCHVCFGCHGCPQSWMQGSYTVYGTQICPQSPEPTMYSTVPLTGARGTVNIRFSENENNSVLTTELRRTGVSSNYNSVVVVVSVCGVHGADARGDVVGLVDPAAGCCRLLVHTDGGGQPALKQRGHRLAVSWASPSCQIQSRHLLWFSVPLLQVVTGPYLAFNPEPTRCVVSFCQDLSRQFASVRQVRGDGNCFYRAFCFAHLESILHNARALQRSVITSHHPAPNWTHVMFNVAVYSSHFQVQGENYSDRYRVLDCGVWRGFLPAPLEHSRKTLLSLPCYLCHVAAGLMSTKHETNHIS